MANYGFKTGNESPLQHEMRKESAAEQKPSPGCGRVELRERFRGKVTSPHTPLYEQTHRGHRQGEREPREVGSAPCLRDGGSPLHTRPENPRGRGCNALRPGARSRE